MVIKIFKAVIFDFDGTLADTKKDIVEAVKKTLSEVGCFVDGYSIEKSIGTGPRPFFKEALDNNSVPYTDSLIDELLERSWKRRLELYDHGDLFEGTIELLTALRDRVRIALATMSPREIIDDLLRKRDIAKYFDVVISASEVEKPKPDPEIFLKCSEQLNLNPKYCVVVEDSVFGVKAAKTAGMRCIAVTTGSYSANELRKEGADMIIPSVNARNEILDFLFFG